MAASKVFTGRKLCKRYQLFFYVALALVGMQMYLAYTFYSMSQNESMKANEWKRRVEQLEEEHKIHKLVHGEVRSGSFAVMRCDISVTPPVKYIKIVHVRDWGTEK